MHRLHYVQRRRRARTRWMIFATMKDAPHDSY